MKKVKCPFCSGFGCCYCDHTGKVLENDECYQSMKAGETEENAELYELAQETAIENSKFQSMFDHHPYGI